MVLGLYYIRSFYLLSLNLLPGLSGSMVSNIHFSECFLQKRWIFPIFINSRTARNVTLLPVCQSVFKKLAETGSGGPSGHNQSMTDGDFLLQTVTGSRRMVPEFTSDGVGLVFLCAS